MATPETQVTTRPGHLEGLRERVVRGSAILLFSTGLVAATNLLYNILIARMLGAEGFGNASALYTLLMLLAAITLSFQIVTSKFIARSSETLVRAQIYASMSRRAWQVGVGIAVLLAAGGAYVKSYFNLPAQHDLWLLAIATGVYIPLGVRRGKMQGCYEFRGIAINVVVEAAVKFGGALLFLHFGMGVTGVMTAVLLSIVAAYIVGKPGAQYHAKAGLMKVAPSGEGMQALLYFIGQVILSNLDILLVKHFFRLSEAGVRNVRRCAPRAARAATEAWTIPLGRAAGHRSARRRPRCARLPANRFRRRPRAVRQTPPAGASSRRAFRAWPIPPRHCDGCWARRSPDSEWRAGP